MMIVDKRKWCHQNLTIKDYPKERQWKKPQGGGIILDIRRRWGLQQEDDDDAEESREEVLNHSEIQSVHYKENTTSPMCYTVNAVFDAPAQAPVTHSLPNPNPNPKSTHFQFKHWFIET